MTNLFDIVTLSEKLTTRKAPVLKKYYLKHGYELKKRKFPLNDSLADPVSIILGSTTVISQIFPNILPAEKTTEADLLKLFPGNGQLTARFRNYLLSKIKYKKDLSRDLYYYTEMFIKENINEFGGIWNQQALDNFYAILRKEAAGGGSQIYPNIYGTNWQEYIPYLAAGGLLLFLLAGKRKK